MSYKNFITPTKSALASPIFWLILVFLYGLIDINLPPIDRHNWRQALTLMISRNFYLLDISIFYPQYDIGGATEGIIPTEFPLYNYLTAVSYHLFGLNDWSARLINWLVTCAGFYYFYKIAKKIFSQPASLVAMLMMMSSVILVYGRKSMPDTFALSLTMMGVYYYWNYAEKRTLTHLVLGCLFMTLGVLSKIPMISFASLLIVPALMYRLKTNQYLLALLSILLFLICVGAWYFYWMLYLEVNFGNKLIWPVSLSEGWAILLNTGAKVVDRITTSTFHNPILIGLAFVGVWAAHRLKKNAFLVAIIAYLLTVLLFIVKTGHTYHLHDYYTISIVPLFCLLVAGVWDYVKVAEKWKYLVTFLLLMPSFINQHNIIQERHEQYFQRLPNLVARLDFGEDDKIMVTGGSVYNPTMMYFTGRRGWSVDDQLLFNAEFINDCIDHGLKYIIVDKHRGLDLLSNDRIIEDDDFIIYRASKGSD